MLSFSTEHCANAVFANNSIGLDWFCLHAATYPMGAEGLFPGVRRQVSVADHSPTS
jgi:hypothetical protein